MNILGDFYEKLPGDKNKRLIREKLDGDNSGWDEQTQGQENVETISSTKQKRSFALFYGAMILIFLLLTIKLWSLQIVNGAYFRELAEGNRIRTKNIVATRGVIYDRNGKLLVRNEAGFNLEVYPIDLPKDEVERKAIYQKIAGIASMTPAEIISKIDTAKDSPLEPVTLQEKIPRETALILKERLANFPAVAVVESSTRRYLAKWGLAHLLGYVGKVSRDDLTRREDYYITDYIGKAGLEASWEDDLKGINGREQIEVDANGNVARVMASRNAQDGNNLITAIDLPLQKKAYEFLRAGAGKLSGKGTVIAMNPQNGEILAMVSLPQYDDNIFTQLSGKQFSKEYRRLINNPKNPMFNRAIAGTYPPGSTIKPVVAASGLQDGTIDINTHIFDPGVISVPNKYNPDVVYKFHCWKRDGHGYVNVVSAIAKSCDTFFYGVGGGYDKISGLGIKKLDKYFELFGLGQQTRIDLPGEASGLVPDPIWKEEYKKESWVLGDNYMLAIGQGDLLVTPLQLLTSTAVIANGGDLVRPHLVKEVILPDGQTIERIGKEVVKKRFISAKNVDIVRQGMRKVVTSGTAKFLSSLPVPVAGKTGTAEFNNKKSLHAWFTAFAPYENPQIAIVVLVEGGGEGNEIAAPIAQKILNYYFTRK